MALVVVMYPRILLTLQEELTKHPDLQVKITGNDIPERIASLAAELNVLIDGMYMMNHPKFTELCDLLITRMRERNKIIYTGPEVLTTIH